MPTMSRQAKSERRESPRPTLFRGALAWFFRRAMGIYFRDVETVGEVPGPTTRHRLFVANHENGLIDPILVLVTAPCLVSPVAKSTLWNVPGLRFILDEAQAVPIVRRRDDPNKASGTNDEVFDKVGGWLARGGNILVFPEGTSHSDPKLKPFRTGPARMLLRARELDGAAPLELQPVALAFDEKDTFRSRCLVRYGPVVPLARAGADPDAVTEAIDRGLRDLVVEGDTHEERVLTARLAEMFAHEEGDRSLARGQDIGREVEASREALKRAAPEAVQSVMRSLEAYDAALAAVGLGDEEIAGSAEALHRKAARRTARFAFLPFALVGGLLFAPPYYGVRYLVGRKHAEQDEISTYKLGMGLLLFPTWFLALSIACFVLAPAWPWGLLATGALLVAALSALAWLDALPRLARWLRRKGKRRSLEELRALRREVLDRARAARDGAVEQ